MMKQKEKWKRSYSSLIFSLISRSSLANLSSADFLSPLYTLLPLQSLLFSIPVKISDTSCLVHPLQSSPRALEVYEVVSFLFSPLYLSLSLKRGRCVSLNTAMHNRASWKGQVSLEANLNMNMCLNSRNWTFDDRIIRDWDKNREEMKKARR